MFVILVFDHKHFQWFHVTNKMFYTTLGLVILLSARVCVRAYEYLLIVRDTAEFLN